MLPAFSTPEEAETFVLDKIMSQAAAHSVRFSDFESRLLRYSVKNPTVTEEEMERFEETGDEEFSQRLVELIVAAEREQVAIGGSKAKKTFRQAMRIAGKNRGYLAGVLIDQGWAEGASVRRSGADWLFLATTGFVLLFAIFWAVLNAETIEHWAENFQNSRFGQAVWTPLVRFVDRNFGTLFVVVILIAIVVTYFPQLRSRFGPRN